MVKGCGAIWCLILSLGEKTFLMLVFARAGVLPLWKRQPVEGDYRSGSDDGFTMQCLEVGEKVKGRIWNKNRSQTSARRGKKPNSLMDVIATDSDETICGVIPSLINWRNGSRSVFIGAYPARRPGSA